MFDRSISDTPRLQSRRLLFLAATLLGWATVASAQGDFIRIDVETGVRTTISMPGTATGRIKGHAPLTALGETSGLGSGKEATFVGVTPTRYPASTRVTISKFKNSGTIVAPMLILTSASVVLSDDEVPMTVGIFPHGTGDDWQNMDISVVAWVVPAKYLSSGAPKYDLAVGILSKPVGYVTGWIGLANIKCADVKPRKVHVLGGEGACSTYEEGSVYWWAYSDGCTSRKLHFNLPSTGTSAMSRNMVGAGAFIDRGDSGFQLLGVLRYGSSVVDPSTWGSEPCRKDAYATRPWDELRELVRTLDADSLSEEVPLSVVQFGYYGDLLRVPNVGEGDELRTELIIANHSRTRVSVGIEATANAPGSDTAPLGKATGSVSIGAGNISRVPLVVKLDVSGHYKYPIAVFGGIGFPYGEAAMRVLVWPEPCAEPLSPFPGERGVSTRPTFSWQWATPDIAVSSYRVYLGKDPARLDLLTKHDFESPRSGTITHAYSGSEAPLDGNTTYYWRISSAAVDGGPCGTHSFVTVGAGNGCIGARRAVFGDNGGDLQPRSLDAVSADDGCLDSAERDEWWRYTASDGGTHSFTLQYSVLGALREGAISLRDDCGRATVPGVCRVAKATSSGFVPVYEATVSKRMGAGETTRIRITGSLGDTYSGRYLLRVQVP